MFQPTKYCLEQLLLNGIAATPTPGLPGIFHGTKVALFTSAFLISPQMLWASVVEPAWTGYAQVATVPTGPYGTGAYGAYLSFGLLAFTPGAPVSPSVSVLGYALVVPNVVPASIILLGAETFTTPVTVTDVDTPVLFVPEFSLPPDAVYGSASVVAA